MGVVTNGAHAWCAKNSLIRDMLTQRCLPCVKLSPTCHAALGRCGEARDEATHLHDLVSSSLVYTVFVSKTPIRAFCVHIADCVLSYRCIYYVVSFFAACSIAPAASELVIKSV